MSNQTHLKSISNNHFFANTKKWLFDIEFRSACSVVLLKSIYKFLLQSVHKQQRYNVAIYRKKWGRSDLKEEICESDWSIRLYDENIAFKYYFIGYFLISRFQLFHRTNTIMFPLTILELQYTICQHFLTKLF